MDTLRLTRYHTVQVGLILVSGSVVALASCLFQAAAIFLILLTALITYSLFIILFYRKEGRKWREKLTEWLSRLILARQLSLGIGVSNERKTSCPRFLFTSRGKVALLPHREAQKLIQLILRDFVMSWFKKMSADNEMPLNAARLLEHIAIELNLRFQKVDIDKLILALVPFIDPYLMAVNDAGRVNGRSQTQFDVNHPYCLMLFEKKTSVCHPALRKDGGEIEHARRLVDLFIQCAVPNEFSSCDPARMFVREVLVTKLVLPLISRLCDPDFLLRSIPLILKKASPETVNNAFNQILKENAEVEKDLTQPNGLLSSIINPTTSSYLSRQGTEEEQLDAEEEEEEEEDRINEASSSERQHHSVVYRRPLPGRRNGGRARASTLPNHPPPLSLHHPVREGSVSSLEDEEPGEELEIIGLPSVYITRHVRLELKDGIHTGYIIKFPRSMLSDQDLFAVRPGLVGSDHELEALKRYSDFDVLHKALVRSPLGKHLKGIGGLPNRRPLEHFVKMLPFTSDEPDLGIILERRDGLERYVQAISAVEEIRDSAIFHEFLVDGVKTLKEANVVHSQSIQAHRPTKRFSFIPDWMKSSTEQQQPAQAKQPITEILPTYIDDSLLPLTCTTLHSLSNTPHDKAQSPPPPSTRTPLAATHNPPTKSASLPSLPNFNASTSSLPSSVETSSTLLDAAKLSLPPLSSTQPAHDRLSKSNLPTSWEIQVEQVDTTADPSDVSGSTQKGTHTAGAGCNATSLDTSISSPKADKDITRSKTVSSLDDTTGTPVKTLGSNDIVKTGQIHTEETSLWKNVTSLVEYCAAVVVQYASYLFNSLRSALQEPVTHKDLENLAKEREELSPLANSLLSLANEATRSTSPDLWVTSESTQLALLGVVGGVMDWYIWKELHEVVYDDERWARALFNLRQVLWPNGKLDATTRPPVNEEERTKLRDDAVKEIKKFLPNLLPYVIGSHEYDSAIHHCLDCIQNPRINRHFLYGLLDVVIPELVPEISEKEFHQKIKSMRTLPPFVKRASL